MRLQTGGIMNSEKLDDIDVKILNILHHNARLSAKAIAEQVFVSAPTVALRIDAMIKSGIIQGYYTKINPQIIGNYIKAFIDMEVAPERKTVLYDYLASCPQVIECNHVTGEYSVLIEAIFKSTNEMDKFITVMQTYGRTKTQIVFSTIIDHRDFSLGDDMLK